MRRKANKNLEMFRETQRTRISRWIRNSEAGWLFYDERGTAWHLLSDEATELEREAGRIVGRCVARQRRWSARTVKVLAFALAAFVGAVCLDFFRGYEAVYAVGGFILALFLWVAGAVTIEFLYHQQIRKWRQRIAETLARNNRGGVPDAVEAHHRRYNLFGMVCSVAVVVYFGRVVWMSSVARSDPTISNPFSWADLVLIATILLTASAAAKVEATHRRRKWFD